MRGDQTVWSCDGCRARTSGDLGYAPRGWFTLHVQDAAGDEIKRNFHLCSNCYAGVEWIVRFQGITVPPKVVAEPRQIDRMVAR